MRTARELYAAPARGDRLAVRGTRVGQRVGEHVRHLVRALFARLLLALLEECNPDVSNDRASYVVRRGRLVHLRLRRPAPLRNRAGLVATSTK